jgi:hypothetical protein
MHMQCSAVRGRSGHRQQMENPALSQNITGHDAYIIEKALFYAAHFIDIQPDPLRRASDRDEMIALLRARLGDNFMPMAEMHGRALQEMTGRPFNVAG